MWKQPRGDGADKTAVETSGKQEAQRRVGVKALFYAEDQLFADVPADGLQIVLHRLLHMGHIRVADKDAVGVIMSRRKWLYLFTNPCKVLGL